MHKMPVTTSHRLSTKARIMSSFALAMKVMHKSPEEIYGVWGDNDHHPVNLMFQYLC